MGVSEAVGNCVDVTSFPSTSFFIYLYSTYGCEVAIVNNARPIEVRVLYLHAQVMKAGTQEGESRLLYTRQGYVGCACPGRLSRP